MTFAGRSGGRVLRLCAAAFLADLALYLVMTGVPYRALGLGAGPVLLGLLPGARALPYLLSTVWAGHRTEGKDRLRSARWSLVAVSAAVLGLAAVRELAWMYVILILIGAGLAFFWPALQATLADLGTSPARVATHLGWFNIAWSLGKAGGFAMGGLLLAGPGFGVLFAVAAVSLCCVVFLLSRGRLGSEEGPSTPAGPDPGGPAPAAFRRAAWTANALAFGAGATLNLLFPSWLAHVGRGETFFGAYLGLVFAFQTGTFLVLMRYQGWRYRALPLLLAQMPGAVVLLVLPALNDPRGILLTAPFVGAWMGVTYFASIYYSVSGATGRGRRAGVHEAVLGLGALILPVLGGVIAQVTGRLGAPYVLCGVICLLGVGLQAWWLRRLPQSGAGSRENAVG